MSLIRITPILFSTVALAGVASNSSQIEFDMKDPKGVAGLAISIDAPLEPVRGFSNGLSGSVTFDAEHPEKSSGTITVSAKSIFIGNQGMTDAMQSDWCLNVAKYPNITFTVKSISNMKRQKDGSLKGKVTGDMTLHGSTKAMTVDAQVLYLEGKLKTRGGIPKDGDLIQIHSKFVINRRDFGIAPDLSSELIGDKITIDLASTGVHIR